MKWKEERPELKEVEYTNPGNHYVHYVEWLVEIDDSHHWRGRIDLTRERFRRMSTKQLQDLAIQETHKRLDNG